MSGVAAFCEWFSGLLQLPFEEWELRLIGVFGQLLNVYEVMECLLQNQETTKYLLRPTPPNDNNRLLREAKNKLIQGIIGRGKTDWAGL